MIDNLSEKEFYDLYFEYLLTRGFNPEKIAIKRYKTPDLKVYNDELIVLNEVKIPELIFNDKLGVYVFKTTHSKLLDFINTALKQLESYDPTHSVPWVITFAANHMQMNWKKFNDAINGGVEFDNKLSPDFTNTDVFKRMREKIKIPDLYIWFQVSEEKEAIFQVSFFINKTSLHIVEVRKLVKYLSSVRISAMDNHIELP